MSSEDKGGLTPVSTAPDGSDLTPADFVHLHNHTQYSLLDGLTKIPDLIDFVKSEGMEAVDLLQSVVNELKALTRTEA